MLILLEKIRHFQGVTIKPSVFWHNYHNVKKGVCHLFKINKQKRAAPGMFSGDFERVLLNCIYYCGCWFDTV
jgi:hypothetical protein